MNGVLEENIKLNIHLLYNICIQNIRHYMV